MTGLVVMADMFDSTGDVETTKMGTNGNRICS